MFEDFDSLQLGSRRPPTQWVSFDSGQTLPKQKGCRGKRRKATREDAGNADEASESADNSEATTIRPVRGSRCPPPEKLKLLKEPRDPELPCMAPEKHDGNVESKKCPPPEKLKLLKEPRDPKLPCMAPEKHDGNVEYKLQLHPPSAARFQQLITQMNFRLSEGNGECYYAVGVEDDGYPKGLDDVQLESSAAVLHLMANTLNACVRVVKYMPGVFGRRCLLLHVKLCCLEVMECSDLRIAVAGSVESGKSTLVAVLTQGNGGRPLLDCGRGSARMAVLRHKHEVESGRTSSISQQVLGYDSDGSVLNYAGMSALMPSEISSQASKLLTFIDMGGHERCLKTALYGMTALLPDYALLSVSAVTGVQRMTREHLAVAQMESVVTDVRTLLSPVLQQIAGTPHAARIADLSPLMGTDEAPATETDGSGGEERGEETHGQSDMHGQAEMHGHGDMPSLCIPIFTVSSVSGEGVSLLHAFLKSLQPTAATTAAMANAMQQEPSNAVLDAKQQSGRPRGAQGTKAHSENESVHFQVDETFQLESVGSVVSGIVVQGVIHQGMQLVVGPTSAGTFMPVEVTCIRRSHVSVRRVVAGQTATLALQPVGFERALVSDRDRCAVAAASSSTFNPTNALLQQQLQLFERANARVGSTDVCSAPIHPISTTEPRDADVGSSGKDEMVLEAGSTSCPGPSLSCPGPPAGPGVMIDVALSCPGPPLSCPGPPTRPGAMMGTALSLGGSTQGAGSSPLPGNGPDIFSCLGVFVEGEDSLEDAADLGGFNLAGEGMDTDSVLLECSASDTDIITGCLSDFGGNNRPSGNKLSMVAKDLYTVPCQGTGRGRGYRSPNFVVAAQKVQAGEEEEEEEGSFSLDPMGLDQARPKAVGSAQPTRTVPALSRRQRRHMREQERQEVEMELAKLGMSMSTGSRVKRKEDKGNDALLAGGELDKVRGLMGWG
eukprot:gene6225-2842_t